MSFSIPLRLAQILKASPNRSKFVAESIERAILAEQMGSSFKKSFITDFRMHVPGEKRPKRNIHETSKRLRSLLAEQGIKITVADTLRLRKVGRA